MATSEGILPLGFLVVPMSALPLPPSPGLKVKKGVLFILLRLWLRASEAA